MKNRIETLRFRTDVKARKLINRLLAVPKDFTWDELTKVLAIYGYAELTGGKTGGSRRRFIDKNKAIIALHKPHPANIVKAYAIREVIAHLKEKGHINMSDILQYQNYYASVHFSSEDEVFYGKILGINDLVSFEGTSVKELKKSFKEAVEDYLETCLAVGKDPEKTYKGTFNVRVPSNLHKEAAVFAAVHNMTLNEFVKVALFFTLHKKEEINQVIDNRKQTLLET